MMRENFPHNGKCAGRLRQFPVIFAKLIVGIVSAKEFLNNVLTVFVI
jgi:hypothetical protein